MHTEEIEMWTKVHEFETKDKYGEEYRGRASIVYDVLVADSGVARMFEATLEIYGDDNTESFTADTEQEAVDEINLMLEERNLKLFISRHDYTKNKR